MTRSSLCFLLAAATTASAAAPSWQEEVASAMVATDPGGDWQIVPAGTTQAARAKADILIEAFADGSTSATWSGEVTLTGGTLAATSLDGTQALLVAESVRVCDPVGCEMLPSIDPDEIDFQLDAAGCAWPMCGGLDVLVAASPAYLVVDVTTGRDGATRYTVTDLLIGFGTAVTGVEPDEID